MIDFTLSNMILETANKNKLLSTNELNRAQNLLRSEERIKRLVEMNKASKELLEKYSKLHLQVKFIKSRLDEWLKEKENKDGET